MGERSPRSGAPPRRGGLTPGSRSNPLTGRTHQLRVHCAAHGLADRRRRRSTARAARGGPALQLHAREIVVPLYKNKPPIARHGAGAAAHARAAAACGAGECLETEWCLTKSAAVTPKHSYGLPAT